MSNKTTREILKDLLYKTPCGEEYDNLTIDKSISDLKELLKSKVPKKREVNKFSSNPSICFGNHGFNQAIDQFNQAIEEMFK